MTLRDDLLKVAGSLEMLKRERDAIDEKIHTLETEFDRLFTKLAATSGLATLPGTFMTRQDKILRCLNDSTKPLTIKEIAKEVGDDEDKVTSSVQGIKRRWQNLLTNSQGTWKINQRRLEKVRREEQEKGRRFPI